MFLIFMAIASLCWIGCSDSPEIDTMMEEEETIEMIDSSSQAVITSVSVSGEVGDYTFRVGIASPDTGCDQYANWWEVFSLDGALLYRRILGHSHVDEQPFERSGGPVNIQVEQEVIIRAHMNNTGYGRQAYKGSVSDGFEETILEEDFHLELADSAPLPGDCAF